MSNEPKKRSRKWIWWLAVLALLLLYPLSIGPAYWLAIDSPVPVVSVKTLNWFYAPVWRLWAASDWAKGLVNWYMRFWVRRFD
jgi:hypothetical protein